MYPTPARPAFGTFVHEQVESLRSAGVEVEVLTFDGGNSLGNYLKAGSALRARLKTGRFDIVHAHYGLTGLPARMQFTCPVVLTYHGSDILGEVGPTGRYSLAGRFKVLLSKALGAVVSERIIVAERMRTRLWSATVIPMGVDLDLFRPRSRPEARVALGLDPARKYVLFVANPGNRCKRFDIADAAVRILAADDPGVEILPVYKATHEQVAQYMNASNVLVLTSDHEGSPCVVKEALASNLPIVSVDCGDVRDRISGVRGCFLCDRDPQDVAASLREALLFDGPTNGREHVEAISLPNTARRTIDVYEKALRRSGR
jgi:glycosyltransferase involved in cell wall biosynthesis